MWRKTSFWKKRRIKWANMIVNANGLCVHVQYDRHTHTHSQRPRNSEKRSGDEVIPKTCWGNMSRNWFWCMACTHARRVLCGATLARTRDRDGGRMNGANLTNGNECKLFLLLSMLIDWYKSVASSNCCDGGSVLWILNACNRMPLQSTPSTPHSQTWCCLEIDVGAYFLLLLVKL